MQTSVACTKVGYQRIPLQQRARVAPLKMRCAMDLPTGICTMEILRKQYSWWKAWCRKKHSLPLATWLPRVISLSIFQNTGSSSLRNYQVVVCGALILKTALSVLKNIFHFLIAASVGAAFQLAGYKPESMVEFNGCLQLGMGVEANFRCSLLAGNF